ncbi:MAG: hypothetical protein LBS21_00140 [Clostridiales bacterium]|jgi:hypothetical protein|nr:hypothetical protein [Clostridiales bacterium]
MDLKNGVLSFGKMTPNKPRQKKHTPSTMQADALFTFTTKLEYLMGYLELSYISPRYYIEDIKYLRIPKLKKIAYPMKCFCDINLHKLDVHIEWYGNYGLAFSKEWGMNKGIQPIQYINLESELRKSFTTAFSLALKTDTSKESKAQIKMENFLLHEMMYFKPYSGIMKNRTTGKNEVKCFTDECEWRYISDVTIAGFEQVHYDNAYLNEDVLNYFNGLMAEVPEIALSFNYEDIKYIIVKSNIEFRVLTEKIVSLNLGETEKYQLMSKIVVWDNSRGDF